MKKEKLFLISQFIRMDKNGNSIWQYNLLDMDCNEKRILLHKSGLFKEDKKGQHVGYKNNGLNFIDSLKDDYNIKTITF